MKKTILTFLLVLTVFASFAQSARREISVKKPRMFGDDVTFVQSQLVAMGFTEVGEIDGYYGPKSEQALKALQELIGMEVTGIVTGKECDFLLSKENENIKTAIAAYNANKNAGAVEYTEEYKLEHYPPDQILSVYKKNGAVTRCMLEILYNFYSADFNVYKVNAATFLLVCKESFADLPEGANPWEVVECEYRTEIASYLMTNGNLRQIKNGQLVPCSQSDIKQVINDCMKKF